jgi:transposase
MRGSDTFNESLFTMRTLEEFVPSDHPLRAIRLMVNKALVQMKEMLDGMYEPAVKGGRPSIAPEKLLRAMLLQIFYSVRSERMLMEQTQYNLLYRWFIGLAMDDTVWVPTVFTKNRDRLLTHNAVIELFNQILAQAQEQDLLSGEHFSVDGTLIQAWASHKSFVAKDTNNGTGGDEGGKSDGSNFKGQQRSNATHESTTDADARLYRKGNTAAKLSFMGHTLSDNRHGLIANARLSIADGHAEREAAKIMIADVCQASRVSSAMLPNAPIKQITLGADKGYDAQEFVEALQAMNVTAHIAQNKSGRRSNVADEVAQTIGYKQSQQKRKLIEQGFGWAKTVGAMQRVLVRGLERVDQMFMLTMTAFNITRMRSLGEIRLKAQTMGC